MLKLSICSLLRDNKNLNIHIFTMDSPETNQRKLSQEQVAALEKEIQTVDPVSSIYLYDVGHLNDEILKDGVNTYSRYGPYAAIRLLAPEVFKISPMEYLLYLDCDTLICGDLREIDMDFLRQAYFGLTSTKIETDTLILESEDLFHKYIEQGESRHRNRLHLISCFLFFNLKKIKENPVVMENILNYYKTETLNCPDQDALAFVPYNKYIINSYFNMDFYDDKTKVLHYHYNNHHPELEELFQAVLDCFKISDIISDKAFPFLADKIASLTLQG